MRLFASAIRASGEYKLRDYVQACVVTAIVPAITAWLFMELVPTGCDIRGDPSVYRWTCLLPDLMIAVPAVVAFCLPLAINFNRRLGHGFPDGWLMTTLAVGFVAHLALVGGYLLFVEPAYRSMLLGELAFIPQPFVAGAIAGGIYWVTLNLGGRPGSSSCAR